MRNREKQFEQASRKNSWCRHEYRITICHILEENVKGRIEARNSAAVALRHGARHTFQGRRGMGRDRFPSSELRKGALGNEKSVPGFGNVMINILVAVHAAGVCTDADGTSADEPINI